MESFKPKIYLTFDIEEWRLPHEYGIKSRYNKNTSFSRIGINNILSLLEKNNIKSTFFVTGYFAEKERMAVKKIIEKGHEIASHSYSDESLTELNIIEARKNLTKAGKILKRIGGKSPIGFRAPNLKINEQILSILEELCYRYDSSIHPAIVPGRYNNFGYLEEPYNPNKIDISRRGEMKILEIPITVISLIHLPISWWWMRNIGGWLTKLGTMINLAKGRNVILYFHGWDFVEMPKVGGMPSHIVKNTGVNFLMRMESFISHFKKKGYEFDTLENLARFYQKS